MGRVLSSSIRRGARFNDSEENVPLRGHVHKLAPLSIRKVPLEFADCIEVMSVGQLEFDGNY